jgi:hypothetical protein
MRMVRLLVATMVLPGAALAADTTLTFGLLPDPANMVGCIRFEPAMERPYTLTVSGSTVELTSAGGISMRMAVVRPDVYHAVFDLSGERLDYTADLGATKSLSVRDNNLGCKFSAKPS